MNDNLGVINVKRKKRPGEIVLYTALFLGTITMFFPFVYMLLSTFKTLGEFMTYPPRLFPEAIIFDNYIEVWTRMNFARYFTNSLFVSTCKTIIVVYTSLLAGYVFEKLRFKGRDLIFYIIIATMMIPFQSTIISMYKLMIDFGWVDNYLSIIVGGEVGLCSAFGIFLMRQSMKSVPDAIIESGVVDGAGHFRIFHRLVVPLMGPAMTGVGVLTFLFVWEDFLWPFLMIHSMSGYTLPIGIAMFAGQYVDNTVGAMTAASIAILPVIVLYLIFQKQFMAGVATAGIKG